MSRYPRHFRDTIDFFFELGHLICAWKVLKLKTGQALDSIYQQCYDIAL